MNWSVEDFSDQITARNLGLNLPLEDNLLQDFQPPASSDHSNEPRMLVDKNGKILCWYLPKIISEHRAVRHPVI